MALAADVRPHLLARGIAVRVVVGDALLGFERLDPGDESRARHAQPHRLGLVAVHAGERVLDQELALVVLHVVRLLVGHGVDLLEALRDVALADETVESQVRRVTLQAGAGWFFSVTRRVCSWSKSAKA